MYSKPHPAHGASAAAWWEGASLRVQLISATECRCDTHEEADDFEGAQPVVSAVYRPLPHPYDAAGPVWGWNTRADCDDQQKAEIYALAMARALAEVDGPVHPRVPEQRHGEAEQYPVSAPEG
jgi:hypothetical protein